MPAYLLPNGWKRVGKLDDVFVLRALSDFAEARVVTILLPPLRISAGRLDMAIRVRADPYVGPCWGNGERPDATGERSALLE